MSRLPGSDSPMASPFNRRQLLSAGGLGFLGLNLAQLLGAETKKGSELFMFGGRAVRRRVIVATG
jgi:hypothetical protein